ncbi:hypothetical protein MUK71_05745 [Arthrobacter zhangbolii]|uniref:Uncharacterized protein n=1 Tax=Arthrobacter zhangbolii TaxID=2886936 RepID=A0A9X1M910_9MICC|nr:hypothetical protein [Arthrobacter zhangbolii]MCC3273077.1 hypothetical protein [Arthrobacter zhangbolii]UON93120.1 hypothetical protein MUK71_05745 [Arthrobacter zhangbolii]
MKNGETPAAPAPRRVRVTATGISGGAAPFPVSRELDEQSEVGELVIGSLIRSQLRLALVVGGGFLLILLSVPVLLAFLPVIADLSMFGVPAPWILLGVGVYPLVIGCGMLYVLSAQRNENRYRDLVDGR